MENGSQPTLVGSATALGRAQVLSRALSEAARRARFSTRGRRGFVEGGFHARRGNALARRITMISFWVMVLIPSAAVAIYYNFIASNQYVAEAQFTVQTGDIPIVDNIAALTGIPAVTVIQDTQVVTNYIESRAALEKLQQKINIRSLYSSDKIDFWARFNPDKPIEKFVRYWQSMNDVSIKMPAGIVVLNVRAFTAEDAANIAQAVLQSCEDLVNDLNSRMNADAVANAQQELQRTATRLSNAQLALESARNDLGVLNTDDAAKALDKLVDDSRTTQIQLQQEYATQLRFVNADAPQMLALKSRLDASSAQIADLQSKLTATKTSAAPGQALSSSMTKFAELDLERQIAERLYSGAASSLELATLTAQDKAVYLDTFVSPVVPQESQYPKRILSSGLFALACLAIWGALVGLASLVRNHMA